MSGRIQRLGATRLPRSLPVASMVVLSACSVWAFWPLAPSWIDTPVAQESGELASTSTRQALDTNAFRAPIWVEESVVPAMAEAPERPPLRLQLLAIEHVGDEFRAVLYDPDTDRLSIVSSGQTVSGRLIERVLADAVAVRDGTELHTISLLVNAGEAP